MKRISLILACVVLIFSTKASAFVGGPFDNGDFSTLLDDSGVYQVALRFSNGSGFAQFGNNVNQELFLPTGNANQGGTTSTTFSVLNRSVLYYKGVTYLGTCWGTVDHDAKRVEGITNGNSDITTTQTTTTPGGGTAVSASTSLVFNNLGFPANTQWTCKITKSHPILRFRGKGELTIVNPTVNAAVTTAINNAVALQEPALPVAPAAGPSSPAQIQAFLAALAALQNGAADLLPSASSVDRSSEHIPLIAFGSRIFFNSFR